MTARGGKTKIVTLKWDRARIPLLYSSLQRGVLIKARLGGSIRSLLCDQVGLDSEYVKNRIQTAFLNGKPVDDFDSAIVGEGSVLTLSGAMPGLAGATLRKGGFFSPMRASLSHQNESGSGGEDEGWITVRVFNILLPELAPVLLSQGVFFSREEFAILLRELDPKDREELPKSVENETALSGSNPEEDQKVAPADLIEVRTEE